MRRVDLVARQLGADRAADQLASRGRARRSARFGASASPSSVSLAARQAWVSARICQASSVRAVGGELARDDVGQREVHVVAAEQDVVADRDAVQLEVAVALDHGDQREVGGAAADVDDQDHVADLHLLAPAVAAGLEPG